MMRTSPLLSSNVEYRFDGLTGYGTINGGPTFMFDAAQFHRIKGIKWYPCYNAKHDALYIQNRKGLAIHRYLISCPPGHEIDHINLDTLDNRGCNLRVCTHQQNQCNQPPQKNNTSGVSGVSFYRPRGKYRARIKVCQHEIHLGYYATFDEAVLARDVGVECMFGEYGRLSGWGDPPEWIRDNVIAQCRRFADLSINKAFSFGAAEQSA